jgi:hypothetical protein
MTVTELIAALQRLEPEHGSKKVMIYSGDGYAAECTDVFVSANLFGTPPKHAVIMGD